VKKYLYNNIAALGLLAFLVVFEVLQQTDILPSSSAIVESAKSLYLTSPIIWLGIGAFVSTLVYVNLYIPGPIIIFAAVLSTNGTLIEFLYISIVVTIAAVFACVLSHLLGEQLEQDFKKQSPSSWIFGHCSLYTLGFWYHKTHFTKIELIKNILLTALFLLPYSIFICYLLYPIGNSIGQNTNLYLISGVVIYLVYLFFKSSRLSLRQK